MPTRRDLLRLSTLAPAGALLGACSQAEYEFAERETWRLAAAPSEPVALLRELVRCATLAANSHNTQPWRFALAPGEIAIRPDPTRRTPVVDPDDHHLWVSLGCAAENLVVAAAAFGRRADLRFDPAGAVRVRLDAMPPVRSPLYAAIARRQSTRAEYDGQPLPAAELRALESTASGAGVRALLLTDRQRVDTVTDFVIEAAGAQMRDAAFVRELKQWIRFGDAEALASRDGLSARASGNPATPRWLGSLMFDLLVDEDAEKDRYARQLRSSAGVAVFVADVEGPANWVEVGRACQRFALLAASLGVRVAFVNPPVEVAALRAQFGRWLGIDSRADLVLRFGRGPLLPRSLRRPVDAVIGGAGSLRAMPDAVDAAAAA